MGKEDADVTELLQTLDDVAADLLELVLALEQAEHRRQQVGRPRGGKGLALLGHGGQHRDEEGVDRLGRERRLAGEGEEDDQIGGDDVLVGARETGDDLGNEDCERRVADASAVEPAVLEVADERRGVETNHRPVGGAGLEGGREEGGDEPERRQRLVLMK